MPMNIFKYKSCAGGQGDPFINYIKTIQMQCVLTTSASFYTRCLFKRSLVTSKKAKEKQ